MNSQDHPLVCQFYGNEIERIYESTEWCVKLVIVRPGWENEDKEWEDYEWIYTGHSLKNCKSSLHFHDNLPPIPIVLFKS